MKPATRAHRNNGSDDTVIDARIGMLLRIGMLASAAVILVGGVLFLMRYGQSPIDYTVFHGVPAGLDTLGGIASGATHRQSLAIVQLGMLMLIASPVARVAFSVYAFLSTRAISML
jgi:uncharacterized membrane protein